MDYVPGLVVFGLTIGTMRHLLHSWKTMDNLPKSLQWAGRRREVFSRARACIREMFAGLQSLISGYDQVRQLCFHDLVCEARQVRTCSIARTVDRLWSRIPGSGLR